MIAVMLVVWAEIELILMPLAFVIIMDWREERRYHR